MAVLVLKEKDSPARTIPLTNPTTSIGRRPTNDIVLNDPYVSRAHAEIVAVDNGLYEIRDLGGKHPVRVNEKLISRHILRDGDRIVLGGSTLLFHENEPTAGAVLEFVGENATAREFREILTLDTRQTVSFRLDGLKSKDMAPLQLDHQRLMLFYEFANGVHNHLEDTARLLDEALNAALKTLDAERGFVALVDESTGELCCERVRSRSDDLPNSPIGVSRTIVHKALREGISVLTLDALTDGQFGQAQSIQELAIRSAMCVPLLFHDKVLGVIYLDNRASAGCFGQDDLVFLIALSHMAGLALGNADLHRQVLQENTRLISALKPKFNLIGESEKMAQVFNTLKKAAPTDITILIEGETGTGKELAARAIHALSARSDKAFVAVNCAAIPRELIESELFGHERGAFTGAVQAYEGKFRSAHGGTIFLDEIGDMSLDTQSKVLRALEQREIQSVGGTKTYTVDVRVIAATNMDLRKSVADGQFRQDLFYRLNVVCIEMPALRDRQDDILLLAESFIAGRVKSISPRSRQLMLAYHWPGNVRELKNCIDRAVVMGDGDVIRPEDMPAQVRSLGTVIEAPPESLDDLEREHILRVLRSAKWRKTEAAKILGIARQTLDNKMKIYKIKR